MSLRGALLALALGPAAAWQRHAATATESAVGTLRGSTPAFGTPPPPIWDYSLHGSDWNTGQCCIGVGQSPLNVSEVMAVQPDGDFLFTAYKVHTAPVRMVNNGKGLVAELPPSVGTLALGKRFPEDLTDAWDLWKVEVKHPSEHTFEGVKVPLELQLYHKRRGTQGEPTPDAIAVVSLGFVASANPLGFINALRQGGVPTNKGTSNLVNTKSPASLEFNRLFQASTEAPLGEAGTNPPPAFWQYTGSITAPPCSVGVQWFVRHDPLPAMPLAIQEFKEAILSVSPVGMEGSDKGNTRSLQPSCGRTIMLRVPQDASALLNKKKELPRSVELEKALQEANANKEAFDKALPSPEDGPSLQSVFQDCLRELKSAKVNKKIAEAREDQWCKSELDAKKKLDESGGGVTRLHAGNLLTEARAHCTQQTRVVVALKEEVKHVESSCQAMRLKIEAAGKPDTLMGSLTGGALDLFR